MKFDLKEQGDELTGTVTRERDGEKQSAALAVKRVK
jgi:transcription termination factor Rho